MHTPLADRIRPQSIDEIVGQQHLIGEGKPLRNIIESGELPNLIFYGPSGTGKTEILKRISKIYKIPIVPFPQWLEITHPAFVSYKFSI